MPPRTILQLYRKKSRNIYLLIGIAFAFPLQPQAQLYIGSGTNLISNGGVNLILNNIGLNNNGAFTNNGNTVIFTGNAPASIAAIRGTNLLFNNLQLSKASGDVQLNTGIAVNGNIVFTGGNLQLNNNNIDLGSGAGALFGENEASRIIGTQGGLVLKTATLNSPYAANPGNIGIYITSPANLGSTLIKRGHIAQTVAHGNTGIYRYFDFIPTNNSSLDASIQFNYFDAELNGLPEASLYFWASNDLGKTWNNIGRDGNTTALNLVLVNGVSQLGRFTLGIPTTTGVLPAQPQPVIPSKGEELVLTKIYPNPATNYVNIVFASTADKDCAIALYAQNGQLLELKTVRASKGFNTVYWSLPDYAAGAYYFKFAGVPLPSYQIIKVH